MVLQLGIVRLLLSNDEALQVSITGVPTETGVAAHKVE